MLVRHILRFFSFDHLLVAQDPRRILPNKKAGDVACAISSDLKMATVSQAFRSLALQIHPDKSADPRAPEARYCAKRAEMKFYSYARPS